MIFDPAGNLYGAFVEPQNGVFELSPSNGSWTFTSLYVDHIDELGFFYSPLARDAAGNLYGTAELGGDGNDCNVPYGCGFVYKLTPSAGGWAYAQLYAFTGGADGAFPYGGVIVDAGGNIYGTAAAGGTNYCTYQGCGTVWELTP
ncbi:MAG: choice-of-anchor tandem repeat GloVer-containing protein [Candidatus Korobacteraceae bacterium]